MHKRAGRLPVFARIDTRLAKSALAALAAACGACSLTPAYHRPDLALPPQWDGASADATTLAAATPVKREWWRAFG
ncbi:hypothetical protein G3N92_34835, partial [Burkholderia sp. Ac-20379]|nr:hypothetical protein [Burkholderia sp. Ac-20379]